MCKLELIRLDNISYTYPGAPSPALRDISLCINEGETVLLCGCSGSGKTTLLKLICGLLPQGGAKSGKVMFRGSEYVEKAPFECAFVGHDPFPDTESQLTAGEFLARAAAVRANMTEAGLIAAEAANYFGLDGLISKQIGVLSGGQRQLLRLAAAASALPALLLLDEPTAYLDPIASVEFENSLGRINKELGITAVFTEHRTEEIFPYADRVIVLDGGRLLFSGPPEEAAKAVLRSESADKLTDTLPCPLRIALGGGILDDGAAPPLTVKDGRALLENAVGTGITSIPPRARMTHGARTVELKKVYFRYGRQLPDILGGLDISVCAGEAFFLMGGNGAGKSTALSIACGRLSPYRGAAYINGRRIKRADGRPADGCAYLPQNPLELLCGDTVYSSLKAAAYPYTRGGAESEKRILSAAELLEIRGLLDRRVSELSGGEVQKCALACVLVCDCAAVILDEPAKGLDAHFRKRLGMIYDTLKRRNAAVLTVTHDAEFAADNADRCALLFDGIAISEGSAEEFFGRNFFFTSPASVITRGIIDGAVTADSAAAALRLSRTDRSDAYNTDR